MSEDLTVHNGPRIIDAVVVRPLNHKQKSLEEVILTDYRDYQKHLEGWIEAVSLVYQPDPMDLSQSPQSVSFTMWVNEEYLYKFTVEDWNFTATSVAGQCGRPDLLIQGILGPALVTGPSDDEGETLPIPSVIAENLKQIHMEVVEDVIP